MATTLDFDELNELNHDKQVEKAVKNAKKTGHPLPIPYREFFGKMYISPEQMETRVDLARDIESVMLYVFAYWLIRSDAGISEDELRADAKDKLRDIIGHHTKLDSYLEKHIDKVIDEVIDVTAKHTRDVAGEVINKAPEDTDPSSDTDYWTSLERAMLIAENEANSVENYAEYRLARESGYTKKRWLTENDDKVRITHTLAEGQSTDIDGLFLVGDSLMRFPGDDMYDPDPNEVVNCRCSCIYE